MTGSLASPQRLPSDSPRAQPSAPSRTPALHEPENRPQKVQATADRDGKPSSRRTEDCGFRPTRAAPAEKPSYAEQSAPRTVDGCHRPNPHSSCTAVIRVAGKAHT